MRAFFFYGTLSQGMANPIALAIHRKLGAGRPGTVRGRLFAIAHEDGCYPALIFDPGGYPVHGNVHEATPDFTPADLELLDRYEEFHPDNPASSEYVRQRVAVTRANGAMVDAEVYIYNAPLPPDAREIPGGCFRTYLHEHGLRAFG